MDPVSGMSKGFGFVRFGSEEEKDDVRTVPTHVSMNCRRQGEASKLGWRVA